MLTPLQNFKAPGPFPPAAAPVGRQLCRQYERCVRNYRQGLAACRNRLSRHSVHRLRVAIRRLLACLALLGDVQGRRPAVRALLQRQLRALGALHDTQVQLQILRREPRIAADLVPLFRHLQKRGHRLAGGARKALKGGKAAQRLKKWRPGALRQNSRALERLRRSINLKLRETVRSLAACSSTAADGAVRHRARIVSREFRYAVEALKPGWRSAETGKLLSILRACQGLIGRIHDRELLLQRIERLVAKGKLPATSARPFRKLLRAEMARQLRACTRKIQSV